MLQDEIELLQGVEEEANTPKKRMHPFLYFSLGFFLLAISLSYFLGGQEIFSYIESRTASTTFQEYKTAYKNWTILFSSAQYQQLQQLYLAEQQMEFTACLQGTFVNNTYEITDFFLPLMYHQSFANVFFQACPEQTIILFHTHPYLHCLFSEQDIHTYKESKRKNTDVLMMVMCDRNRFSFYRE